MKNITLLFAGWMARYLPQSFKQSLYASPFLAGVIRRGLNRVAPNGLSTIEVAGGALQGMRLSLDLQDEKDLWLGTYEPELFTALKHLVKPGMVIYDVGANVGYITLFLARKVGSGGQVFAFEPFPKNIDRLKKNLALNPLESEVVVISAAVVDHVGPVNFMVGPSGGMGKAQGSAGREGLKYSAELTVSGITLDEFIFDQGNPAPQIVKMDIEGGEVLALVGMARLLSQSRPVLCLEVHGPEAAQVVWEKLTEANYVICQMKKGFPEVHSLEDLDWKAYLVAKPLP